MANNAAVMARTIYHCPRFPAMLRGRIVSMIPPGRLWTKLCRCKTFATVAPGSLYRRLDTAPRSQIIPPPLDARILTALSVSTDTRTSLDNLVEQYHAHSGNILSYTLPYESRPSKQRQPNTAHNSEGNELVLVAYCAMDGDKYKITISSGFALECPSRPDESLILTCAHTLEEASPVIYRWGSEPHSPTCRYGTLP